MIVHLFLLAISYCTIYFLSGIILFSSSGIALWVSAYKPSIFVWNLFILASSFKGNFLNTILGYKLFSLSNLNIFCPWFLVSIVAVEKSDISVDSFIINCHSLCLLLRSSLQIWCLADSLWWGKMYVWISLYLFFSGSLYFLILKICVFHHSWKILSNYLFDYLSYFIYYHT